MFKTVDSGGVELNDFAMCFICPIPYAISELFFQVSHSGKLTLADRYGILAILLNVPVSDEEINSIDRILYALRQGRIQVVDELSAVL